MHSFVFIFKGLSRAWLGLLSASSFAERMNSAAKIIQHKDNMSLNPDCLDKLVCLRMNREFMAFSRDYFPHLLEHDWQKQVALMSFERKEHEVAAQGNGSSSSAKRRKT